MDREERMYAREQIAIENGFALYRQYDEKEACELIGISLSTLRRYRREGKIWYLNIAGKRLIKYFGYQIADFLLDSVSWQNTNSENTELENTGSASAQAPHRGTEHGLTETSDKHAELRWARQILKKQNQD